MSFMSKVVGFTVAYADWAVAGFPRRSPDWVAELFETHCRPCEFYDPDGKTAFGDKGVCDKCGCHVDPSIENWRNKLILPSSSCPIGKWESSIKKDKTSPSWRQKVLAKQKIWRGKNEQRKT